MLALLISELFDATPRNPLFFLGLRTLLKNKNWSGVLLTSLVALLHIARSGICHCPQFPCNYSPTRASVSAPKVVRKIEISKILFGKNKQNCAFLGKTFYFYLFNLLQKFISSFFKKKNAVSATLYFNLLQKYLASILLASFLFCKNTFSVKNHSIYFIFSEWKFGDIVLMSHFWSRNWYPWVTVPCSKCYQIQGPLKGSRSRKSVGLTVVLVTVYLSKNTLYV